MGSQGGPLPSLLSCTIVKIVYRLWIKRLSRMRHTSVNSYVKMDVGETATKCFIIIHNEGQESNKFAEEEAVGIRSLGQVFFVSQLPNLKAYPSILSDR